MSALRVLYIGGTGIISTACVTESIQQGHDVTILNRGQSSRRDPHPDARLVTGDIRDPESARSALGDAGFDVVCSFVSFTTEHVLTDLELFRGKVGQYVFISSASAYQTPPTHIPVTESTPLRNPYWQYSRDKIACEDLLLKTYRDEAFPMTIVRPSHTYDHTSIVFDGGWTLVDRMRRGAEVVVPGDGTSLWTLTHTRDFAPGFVGLLGREAAIGEAFHITSDEAPTWNAIFTEMAHAAGAEPKLVHVPSDAIDVADPKWGAGLLGDKANTMVFDNSKLRTLVPTFTCPTPFSQGAREIVDWYDADESRKTVDDKVNVLQDKLIEAYRPGKVQPVG
jgi:nucleoside-diphosphate-sugar epimerase